MQRKLNAGLDHEASAARLQATYDAGLIPAEKKPFLIDLETSSGPFLSVDQGDLIFDAASQIASHGLGLNAGALFGAAQYLESWTNQLDAADLRAVRSAYIDLLRRKLGSDEYDAQFCASGAEAVETTLARFYASRPHEEARRVLAFEGSFHGRMMVALASTWNPPKRKPFAWPGFESVFAPYPEMEGDAIDQPQPPAEWKTLWTTTSQEAFRQTLDSCTAAAQDQQDPLLDREIRALSAVRGKLATGKIFAVLIEPMQCEGGDRFSSARFHQGLAYLTTTFNVPLVYDEIQTGFGLGGEFFWHRMFQLRTPEGAPFYPHGIVCAKKAQTGISLCRTAPPRSSREEAEQVSAASLIRGYIQASVIDQFADQIAEIEAANRVLLGQLVSHYPQRICNPRVKGLTFAFDLESPEVAKKFVDVRFEHGLLYYPAGQQTARFRMNLGDGDQEIDLLWQQLSAAVRATFETTPTAAVDPVMVTLRDPSEYFAFHRQFAIDKLRQLRTGELGPREEVLEFLNQRLTDWNPHERWEVVLLDAERYAEFRERILRIQELVYEPARRTPAAEFDALFASGHALSILVLHNDQVVAMAFAGPLPLFTHQGGVTEDPQRDNPAVDYMVDLTVVDPHRGSLGRWMKQAMMILAQRSGVDAIHGRNRDRWAAGMWAINLSLGSYATQYLKDEYPDEGSHRDCFYYRCPTVWSQPPLDLSDGIEAPLGVAQLDQQFIHDELPVLVNKLTLSNFITPRFLQQLEEVATLFPEPLRHIYTAGGLSEAVDKVAKVLWKHREPRTRLVTLEGSWFGQGSFLSRSLSGTSDFFPVQRLPLPRGDDDQSFFDALQSELKSDAVLGVFIEPLMRGTMQPLDKAIVARIIQTCRSHQVPIVFNDTAGLFYRYSTDAFSPSGVPELLPDATIAYLGGQMAIVGCQSSLFLDQPLLLISTWEGDALSLAQFHRAAMLVQQDSSKFHQVVAAYHQKLNQQVEQAGDVTARLCRGVGCLQGKLPAELQGKLRAVGPDQFVSCPSYSSMLRFLSSD